VAREGGRWGTHTLRYHLTFLIHYRKTYYLFAIWGGGVFQIVMEGARHSSVENARRYEKGALQAKKYCERNSKNLDFRALVPKHEEILIADSSMIAALNPDPSDQFLYDIASDFLMLQVSPLCQPGTKTVGRIIAASLQWKKVFNSITLKPSTALGELELILR
jgi:hypothetical protein